MSRKRIKKNKNKIRFDRVIILILFVAFAFILLKWSIKRIKLIKNGYSREEIQEILDKVNPSDCVLTEGYNEYLTQIVNDKNFIETNICKYVKIFNSDTGVKYKSSLMEIVNDSYYIDRNSQRYIAYYESNKSLTVREIVEAVNCNLDRKYYSGIESSDLSKEHMVIVNKYYSLDSNYAPSDLVQIDKKYGNERYVSKTLYDAFIRMYNDIKKVNMSIYIVSPYRSYNYQKNLYDSYVEKEGVSKADTFSARAGHSEHQTGLAIDISDGKKSYTSFERTEEYIWMNENAHKYGFILRYPEGKEKQTGYMFEAWHYRYVGVEAATYIKENGITFDEYYEFFLNK